MGRVPQPRQALRPALEEVSVGAVVQRQVGAQCRWADREHLALGRLLESGGGESAAGQRRLDQRQRQAMLATRPGKDDERRDPFTEAAELFRQPDLVPAELRRVPPRLAVQLARGARLPLRRKAGEARFLERRGEQVELVVHRRPCHFAQGKLRDTAGHTDWSVFRNLAVRTAGASEVGIARLEPPVIKWRLCSPRPGSPRFERRPRRHSRSRRRTSHTMSKRRRPRRS